MSLAQTTPSSNRDRDQRQMFRLLCESLPPGQHESVSFSIRLFRVNPETTDPPSLTIVALAIPSSFDINFLKSNAEISFFERRSGSSAKVVVFNFSTPELAESFYERNQCRWISAADPTNVFCLQLLRVDLVVSSVLSVGLLVELPSCVVCLDRLDPSITGLGPGVCSHHTAAGEACDCWRAFNRRECAVCSNLDSATNAKRMGGDRIGNVFCEICNVSDRLWYAIYPF